MIFQVILENVVGIVLTTGAFIAALLVIEWVSDQVSNWWYQHHE